MKKDSLAQEINEATKSLLKRARELSWNTIADNCRYIVTEIDDNLHSRPVDERIRIRKNINSKKTPEPLLEAVARLQKNYPNLYDINLYVYHSTKSLTIVEIQYYPKSALDPDYRRTVEHKEPMLHSKIPIPLYATEGKERFDINWELGTWEYKWKMFWWKVKLGSKLKKIRNNMG